MVGSNGFEPMTSAMCLDSSPNLLVSYLAHLDSRGLSEHYTSKINEYIGKYLRNFKEVSTKSMDKYDIPWTAYEEVLELVRRYAKEQDEELTARQAKWIWRLIQIGSFRSQLGSPRLRVSSLMQLTNRYITHEHQALFKLPLTESLESISESVEREVKGVNNVT